MGSKSSRRRFHQRKLPSPRHAWACSRLTRRPILSRSDPMTSKRKPTSDGIAILEQRYYSDPKRMADLEKARFHAKLAQVIYARRKALGLTQAELAKRA